MQPNTKIITRQNRYSNLIFDSSPKSDITLTGANPENFGGGYSFELS